MIALGDEYRYRGQSEVLGSLAMVAIVIILATVILYPLLDIAEDRTQPAPAVVVGIDVDGEMIEIRHDGGSTLTTANLELLVDQEEGLQRVSIGDPEHHNTFEITPTDIDEFSSGEQITIRVDNADGEVMRVDLIDRESNFIIGTWRR